MLLRIFALFLLMYLLACTPISPQELQKVRQVQDGLPDGCVISSYTPNNNMSVLGTRRHVFITVDCYE